jgi:hypothetical protein
MWAFELFGLLHCAQFCCLNAERSLACVPSCQTNPPLTFAVTAIGNMSPISEPSCILRFHFSCLEPVSL